MQMSKHLYIILITVSSFCFSQNRNSVWIFGDSAGISINNLTSPIPINSEMNGRGSCASISDTNGNLLLYSWNLAGTDDSATFIFNALNDTMVNGSRLTGGDLYNQIVIAPFPALDKYYVFHLGVLTTYGLYYSLVDMTQDSGRGAVVQKNIQLNNFRPGDCLTVIKHGNGRDWWVISKYSATSPPNMYNRFFVYLVTHDSIYSPIVQDFNDARDADVQKIIWHPSGDKFMQINIGGYMSEFDFDRCSGSITLNRNIFPQQSGNFNRLFWEGAYSASGNVFYVSTDDFPGINTMYLLQIDLTAVNIPASIDTLDIWPTNNISTGAVRLAPDNKIYFSRWYLCNSPQPYCYPYPDTVRNYVNENLSVINTPDSLGSACNYQPFSFYLGGKRTYAGLPNNPNYDLGAVQGSICDSLTVSVNSPSVTTTNSTLTIFYHPTWQTAFINAQHLKGKQVELLVYNVTGQLTFKTKRDVYNGYYTYDLDMSGYAKGLYIVSLRTEKEMLVKKMVRE